MLALFLCRARALERQIAFDEKTRKSLRSLFLCVCVRGSGGVREVREREEEIMSRFTPQRKSKKNKVHKKQDVVVFFMNIHRCNKQRTVRRRSADFVRPLMTKPSTLFLMFAFFFF